MANEQEQPKKGTIVTLQLPLEAAKRLRQGFERRDPKLMEIMKECKITDIRVHDTPPRE